MLAIAYTLLALILVWRAHFRLSRGQFNLPSGAIVGTLYFVYIPLGILLLSGELRLPPEFASSVLLEPQTPRDNDLLWKILLLTAPLILADLVFATRTRRRTRCWTSPSTEPALPIAKFFIVIYLSISAFLFVVSGLSGGGHWYETRHAFALQYGQIGTLLVFISAATRLVILSALAADVLTRRLPFMRFALILAALTVIELYVTGNRLFLFQGLVVSGGLLLAQGSYRRLALLAAVAIPLGLLMNLFRYVRAYLHSGGFSSGVDFALQYSLDRGIRSFALGVTESVNLNTLASVIHSFPEKHDYYYGISFLKILVAPIPRSIWPSKPEPITSAVAGLFARPGATTSFATTIFGESYINFGLFGAVAVPLIVALCHLPTRRRLRDPVFAILAFTLGLTGARMAFSDVFLTGVISVFLIWGHRSLSRMTNTGAYRARGRRP